MDPESRARGFGPECWQLILGEEHGTCDTVPGQMSIFDLTEEVESCEQKILPDLREDVF